MTTPEDNNENEIILTIPDNILNKLSEYREILKVTEQLFQIINQDPEIPRVKKRLIAQRFSNKIEEMYNGKLDVINSHLSEQWSGGRNEKK